MIVEISIIIIATFIVILVIGLLIVFFQIRRTAKELEKFLEMSRHQIAPLSHDVALIIHDGKQISESLKKQVNKLDSGVDAIKDVALSVKNFETVMEDRLKQPILDITTFIVTFAQIIQNFRIFFTRKERNSD